MRKFIFFALVSLMLVFSAALSAQAGDISPELQSSLSVFSPAEEIPVIVTLSDRVNFSVFKDNDKGLIRAKLIRALREKADSTQKPLKAFLEGRGAKRLTSLWVINGIAFTAIPEVIRALANQSGVESIRLDDTLTVPGTNYSLSTAPEWNLNTIRAVELWNSGYTGQGITIANIDTGVDINHPDLSSKWRGGTNSWFDPNSQHSAPYDSNGHGTQTMGVMVGGSNGGTAIGVAPDAQWIAVKIFNDAGVASFSGIHLGFQWLLDPDGNPATNDAPDIVNNSWGLESNYGGCVAEFKNDIQALKTADIAVVFSAGNGGPYVFSSVSPANYPDGFAVGATDITNTIAGFSSRGPSACDGSIYPEVAAPGVNIKTADLTFGGIFPNSYVTVSGTSFAAPHVSGVMALLLSAFPGLRVQDLEAALKASSTDMGPAGPENVYGYGLIDASAAYNFINLSAGTLPPVAMADAYTVAEDNVLSVAVPGVLSNDTDQDGDPLAAVLASSVSKGILTLQPDGAFTYMANSNFNGVDSFTYRSNDGLLESNLAAVTITVKPVNDAPVAVNDSATTVRYKGITINVVANDYDIDSIIAPATVKIVTLPGKGKVVNNFNGTVRYTPNWNFRGKDSFVYTVKDSGTATSNIATVTVNVK